MSTLYSVVEPYLFQCYLRHNVRGLTELDDSLDSSRQAPAEYSSPSRGPFSMAVATEGFLCAFSFRVVFNSFNLLIFTSARFQHGYAANSYSAFILTKPSSTDRPPYPLSASDFSALSFQPCLYSMLAPRDELPDVISVFAEAWLIHVVTDTSEYAKPSLLSSHMQWGQANAEHASTSPVEYLHQSEWRTRGASRSKSQGTTRLHACLLI